MEEKDTAKHSRASEKQKWLGEVGGAFVWQAPSSSAGELFVHMCACRQHWRLSARIDPVGWPVCARWIKDLVSSLQWAAGRNEGRSASLTEISQRQWVWKREEEERWMCGEMRHLRDNVVLGEASAVVFCPVRRLTRMSKCCDLSLSGARFGALCELSLCKCLGSVEKWCVIHC